MKVRSACALLLAMAADPDHRSSYALPRTPRAAFVTRQNDRVSPTTRMPTRLYEKAPEDPMAALDRAMAQMSSTPASSSSSTANANPPAAPPTSSNAGNPPSFPATSAPWASNSWQNGGTNTGNAMSTNSNNNNSNSAPRTPAAWSPPSSSTASSPPITGDDFSIPPPGSPMYKPTPRIPTTNRQQPQDLPPQQPPASPSFFQREDNEINNRYFETPRVDSVERDLQFRDAIGLVAAVGSVALGIPFSIAVLPEDNAFRQQVLDVWNNILAQDGEQQVMSTTTTTTTSPPSESIVASSSQPTAGPSFLQNIQQSGIEKMRALQEKTSQSISPTTPPFAGFQVRTLREVLEQGGRVSEEANTNQNKPVDSTTNLAIQELQQRATAAEASTVDDKVQGNEKPAATITIEETAAADAVDGKVSETEKADDSIKSINQKDQETSNDDVGGDVTADSTSTEPAKATSMNTESTEAKAENTAIATETLTTPPVVIPANSIAPQGQENAPSTTEPPEAATARNIEPVIELDEAAPATPTTSGIDLAASTTSAASKDGQQAAATTVTNERGEVFDVNIDPKTDTITVINQQTGEAFTVRIDDVELPDDDGDDADDSLDSDSDKVQVTSQAESETPLSASKAMDQANGAAEKVEPMKVEPKVATADLSEKSNDPMPATPAVPEQPISKVQQTTPTVSFVPDLLLKLVKQQADSMDSSMF